MPKRRCMVRVTQVVSAEMLCKAIETSKTLTAEQIAKNKAGEEVRFIGLKYSLIILITFWLKHSFVLPSFCEYHF